jgi:hypothetical protein
VKELNGQDICVFGITILWFLNGIFLVMNNFLFIKNKNWLLINKNISKKKKVLNYPTKKMRLLIKYNKIEVSKWLFEKLKKNLYPLITKKKKKENKIQNLFLITLYQF